MTTNLIFVIPVYNDWESAKMLLRKTEALLDSMYAIHFVFINDSSTEEPSQADFQSNHFFITILELSRNLGHQKAIATGLAYVNKNLLSDYIVVMDSDGEDRPEDIQKLMTFSANFNGIIFAKRAKRTEGLLFQVFYRLYKLIFVLLTGKRIDFGNYCVIPYRYLRKLVQVPDIWNHFSGGAIRSGILYTSVATEKGRRYFGESKMNFPRLILHGLSAVSVYADIMSIRLILVSFFLALTTVSAISLIIIFKLFSEFAVPSWATYIVLSLCTIFFLALFLGLFLLFNILALKTQKPIIPAKDFEDYLYNIKTIQPKYSNQIDTYTSIVFSS